MCGIIAIHNQTKKVEDKRLAMLYPIAHRGEQKYFNESAVFENCILGMNRLAIVDRQKAKQPMHSNDGRYNIIFNGEIYNYLDLRKELLAKGHLFMTDSDTEVLLNGYIEWQEKILEKISGMFAFFIYDNKENKFFVARDPFGVKPLYFGISRDQTYYFGSEIKSLTVVEKIGEINLFPPGHFMAGGKLKKYFYLPNKLNDNITEKEAIVKIRELFDNSIKMRVNTDLPIAVYFSGGVDSASVLATARKYHPDVTAIIIGNTESSDRKTAVRYCEENNIKYIVKNPPKEEELFKNIKEITRITESFEPNMIRQSSISYYIAQTAAENNFKVILCGEGADEIFAGYPEFTNLKNDEEIQKKIFAFLTDLHRTQLQRVDRTSMHFTTEVREPFLDRDLVNFTLQIPPYMKIKKVGNTTITKYILRKAMEDRLPEYIYNRTKVVLSEGAGYKGNQTIGGLFYDATSKVVSDEELDQFKKKYKDWNLANKEEVYYFKYYLTFGYKKAKFNQKRTTVNKIDTEQRNARMSKEILDTFNVWQFKREQPHTAPKIQEKILEHVKEDTPVSFIMYWGKGKKEISGNTEVQALKYLCKMLDKVKEKHEPGTSLTIIFTDTHAKLNGYSEREIKTYFDSVKKQISDYGFNFLSLSELVTYDENELMEKIDKLKIKNSFLANLEKSSFKHFRRGANTKLGAKLYFLQNQKEKGELEKVFPDSIFLTYNGSDLNAIFPLKLPVFYMYSLKKGTSVKPWFCD